MLEVFVSSATDQSPDLLLTSQIANQLVLLGNVGGEQGRGQRELLGKKFLESYNRFVARALPATSSFPDDERVRKFLLQYINVPPVFVHPQIIDALQ